MNWINLNDEKPKKYEEVIIASIDGAVKSAVYLDNGKFTTYLNVTHWMHMPEAPKLQTMESEPVKKTRGRPKKK